MLLIFSRFSSKSLAVLQSHRPHVLRRTHAHVDQLLLTTPRGYVLPGETLVACSLPEREAEKEGVSLSLCCVHNFFFASLSSPSDCPWQTHNHIVHRISLSGLMSDWFTSSGHLLPPAGCSQEDSGMTKNICIICVITYR